MRLFLKLVFLKFYHPLDSKYQSLNQSFITVIYIYSYHCAVHPGHYMRLCSRKRL